ncbi:MAG: DUF1826 domain-containing protein [Pseudomonadota bacterium]
MSIQQPILSDSHARIGIVEEPEGLSAIRRPGYPAVIWQRSPMARFQTWIDGLDPQHLPSTRTTLRPNAVPNALEHLCNAAGTPDCEERACLVGDISALAYVFAEMMQADFLLMRLDIVTTNACRRFHIDAVTARLVCTYRGTGTQYGLASNGEEPGDISTVPTGAPIVLRGTNWPVTPPCGFLHRSPPIEGSGETRLVLVLDPVDSADIKETHHSMH